MNDRLSQSYCGFWKFGRRILDAGEGASRSEIVLWKIIECIFGTRALLEDPPHSSAASGQKSFWMSMMARVWGGCLGCVLPALHSLNFI